MIVILIIVIIASTTTEHVLYVLKNLQGRLIIKLTLKYWNNHLLHL